MKSLAALAPIMLAAVTAASQTGRQALAAGGDRYQLADYRAAGPLISLGLDPKAGAPDSLWRQGVERLADVLLVLRQDSLATTWLRWASRQAPDFDVDAEVVPPTVVRAAAAARVFVAATPYDRFVARVEFQWPSAFRAAALGTVRLAPSTVPITARVGADQFLRGGESRRVPPGSYDVVVSAPGFLPTRLTVEVLPEVTSVVHASLLPETAGVLYVTARPWGRVFLDDREIGYTGIAAHRVAPGSHALRLRRDAGPARDTTIVVGDREQVRLSWVAQPEVTGDPAVDSALRVLDASDLEEGVQLLRQRLPGTAAPGVRSVLLARLAAAAWSLGERDSSAARLAELVRSDPFYVPPADLFNPEIAALYARLRRESALVRIRAPRDTTLSPTRDSLPLAIAVGRPGDVRLVLRIGMPAPRDSVLTTLSVDKVALAKIPLATSDGGVLPAGTYAIEAEFTGTGSIARDVLQIAVERLPFDSAPSRPPLPPTDFLPERRKGRPTARTIAAAIGFGALALAVPTVVNDGGLSGRSIPPAAWLLGGSVAVAEISLKRPSVSISDAVQHNELVRFQWEARNHAIALRNSRLARLASLRIRATRTP